MTRCFKEENLIKKIKKRGRLSKLAKHNKRFINKKFLKYLGLSPVKVTAGFNKILSISISHETV